MAGEGAAGSWMECRLEHGPEATIVRVSGSIDLSNHEDLADALDDALGRPQRLAVVDLLRVKFMGSAGLNVLLEAQRAAVQAGHEVRVVDGGGVSRRVIELTGMNHVLSLFPSVDAALDG